MRTSNWTIFSNRDETEKYLKPPRKNEVGAYVLPKLRFVYKKNKPFESTKKRCFLRVSSITIAMEHMQFLVEIRGVPPSANSSAFFKFPKK